METINDYSESYIKKEEIENFRQDIKQVIDKSLDPEFLEVLRDFYINFCKQFNIEEDKNFIFYINLCYINSLLLKQKNNIFFEEIKHYKSNNLEVFL